MPRHRSLAFFDPRRRSIYSSHTPCTGNAEILARSRGERFQLAFARPLGVVIERVDLRAVAIISHEVDGTCSSSQVLA